MPSGPLAREAPAGAASALFRSRDARSPARQPLREPDGDKRAGFCVLPEEWGGSASRRLTPPSPPCPPARPREAARVSAARPGRAGLGSPAAFPPLWVSTGCRGLAAASPGCAGGGARLGLAAGRPCLRGAGLPFPRPPSRPSPQPEPPPLSFSLSPVAPPPRPPRLRAPPAPAPLFAPCLPACLGPPLPAPPLPRPTAGHPFGSPGASARRPVGGRPFPAVPGAAARPRTPGAPGLFWKRFGSGTGRRLQPPCAAGGWQRPRTRPSQARPSRGAPVSADTDGAPRAAGSERLSTPRAPVPSGAPRLPSHVISWRGLLPHALNAVTTQRVFGCFREMVVRLWRFVSF